MLNALRWFLAVLVVAVALAPPVALYRAQYIHAKRFREVEPGRVYRAGQMTADGFREAVERYGIRTVVNLQHEEPDPLLPNHWLGKGMTRESELCAQLGVKYLLITPDVLPPGNQLDHEPAAVRDWLAVLDDESNYPILLHCKAGLHRTGRLTAIYRMEHRGWTEGEALRELRANGYGFVAASEGDAFVVQFIQNYRPRPWAERLAKQVAAAVVAGAADAGRPGP
jgi:tyrosine-protein phosphatase SIW14